MTNYRNIGKNSRDSKFEGDVGIVTLQPKKAYF